MDEGKTINIVYRRLDEIKPYENNPRRNDNAVDAVAASIKQFGWQQPIIVDKQGVIIAGHTSYKAAQKLGLDTAPVFVADLTEEQATAYRIADNKTADLSEWDAEKLLSELTGIEHIEMRDFGFEDIDFPDFTDGIDLADNEDDGAEDSQNNPTGGTPRLIVTYKTPEEEEYLKNLLGVTELRDSYNFKDIKAAREVVTDEEH